MVQVQVALVHRVDAMEKALLAVKMLHEQSNGREARNARNRALEAKLQLMQKELEVCSILSRCHSLTPVYFQ